MESSNIHKQEWSENSQELYSNIIGYICSDEYIYMISNTTNTTNAISNNSNTGVINMDINVHVVVNDHFTYVYQVIQVLLHIMSNIQIYTIQKEVCICIHNSLQLHTNPQYDTNSNIMPVYINHIIGLIMNNQQVLIELFTLLKSKYTDMLLLSVIIKLLYTIATTYTTGERLWLKVICYKFEFLEIIENIALNCGNNHDTREHHIVLEICNYVINQLYMYLEEEGDVSDVEIDYYKPNATNTTNTNVYQFGFGNEQSGTSNINTANNSNVYSFI